MYENVLVLRTYPLKYLVVKAGMSPTQSQRVQEKIICYMKEKERMIKQKSKCIQLVISG